MICTAAASVSSLIRRRSRGPYDSRVTHASDRSSSGRVDGIATVMCVDLQGSTVAGVGLDAVRSQFDDYGGREVETSAHGIRVVFVSTRQAVGCALAIRRSLDDASATLRIGIGAGEMIDADAEPEGAALEAAARIVTRAERGEVLVSDVVRQLSGTPRASGSSTVGGCDRTDPADPFTSGRHRRTRALLPTARPWDARRISRRCITS
jgi:class 3 adenylate cyclase